MTRQEMLSALVDGELAAAERDRLLAALDADPALRETWSHYQLIGTAIRRGVPEFYDPALAARIAAAVADVEPEEDAGDVLRVPADDNPGRLRRAVGGFAMAASVAAVALLGVSYFGAPGSDGGTVQIAQLAPSRTQAQPVAASTSTQVAAPLDEQRLNDYLQRHNELAVGGGLRTLPPYVRVVSANTSTATR